MAHDRIAWRVVMYDKIVGMLVVYACGTSVFPSLDTTIKFGLDNLVHKIAYLLQTTLA